MRLPRSARLHPKRHLPVVALLPLLLSGSLRAQSAVEWEFVGIEIAEKVGCINNPVTSYEHRWIARGPSYEAELAKLRAELKEKHSYYASLSRYTVRPGKPVVIGVARRTVSCGQWSSNERKRVYSHKFYFGVDRATVEQRARADGEQFKDVLSTEIVEWIDVAAELARRGGGP
jgi:hypothetical protein